MANSGQGDNKSGSNGLDAELEELEVSDDLENLVIDEEKLESEEEPVAELDVSDLSEVEIEMEVLDDQGEDAKTASREEAASREESRQPGISDDYQQKIGAVIQKNVNQGVQKAFDKAVKNMDEHLNLHKNELQSMYKEFSESTQKLKKEISNLQKQNQNKTVQESKAKKDKSGSFFGSLVNVLKFPIILGVGFAGAILLQQFYPQIYSDILNFIKDWNILSNPLF